MYPFENRNKIHSFIQKQDVDIHEDCDDIISILKLQFNGEDEKMISQIFT